MSDQTAEIRKRVEHQMWETRRIGTGVPSQAYKDNWETIFGNKKEEKEAGLYRSAKGNHPAYEVN